MEAYLLAKVTELDKTTLGDVVLYLIKNLTKEQLINIIKDKDRGKYPIQWDLKPYTELAALDVCTDGNPYKRTLFDKCFDLYGGILKRKGFLYYFVNDIECLFLKEDGN